MGGDIFDQRDSAPRNEFHASGHATQYNADKITVYKFSTAGAAMVPRSEYLEQVRCIAPEVLLGRDRELDQLAAFCTAANAPDYQWWRAEAWAGKSALLAWFVLHPPHRVRVISFFITARFQGHHDRSAFLDVVFEQLLDLLDEPKPPHLTEATREGHFRSLLKRAAQRCSDRGERLVLLVDGLDEDRGVDGHSIAALLPIGPSVGIRVIVASRPHPPIPPDVGERHPLRNPGIVRTLSPSPHATAIATEARRDLKKLLNGPDLGLNVLGLITAAGGGLSVGDLAHLTQTDVWRVEELLENVVGRVFTSRPSLRRAGPASSLYLLGHEELHVAATQYLGAVQLQLFGHQLHTWAELFRGRQWPPDTPEYLIRGYHQLLVASGDRSRLVAYGLDVRRHARIRDLTGGDTAILSEVIAAQEAVLASDGPGLQSLGTLAVYRAHLADRNANVPLSLPVTWALLDHPDRAEALGGAIPDLGARATVLAMLARTAAEQRDLRRADDMIKRAEAVATLINDPAQRDAAQVEIVHALASANHIDEGERLVNRIDGTRQQVVALARLVMVLAARGDHGRAATLAERADIRAAGIVDEIERARAFIALVPASAAVDYVRAAREIGRPEEAALLALSDTPVFDHLVQQIRALSISVRADRNDEWPVLAELACAVAAAGDQRAAADLAIEAAAERPAWSPLPVQTRVALIEALIATGQLDRANALMTGASSPAERDEARTAMIAAAAEHGALGLAERLFGDVVDNEHRVRALSALAHASRGAAPQAAALAERAERHARTMAYPRRQAEVATLSAGISMSLDDPALAEEVLENAVAIAEDLTRGSGRIYALGIIARAFAKMQRTDRATEVVDQVEEELGTEGQPARRALMSICLADAVHAVGDTQRAAAVLDRVDGLLADIDGEFLRGRALAAMVRSAAAVGDQPRARAWAQRLTRLIPSIERHYEQPACAELVLEAIGPLVSTAELDLAAELAHAIEDAEWREAALGVLAEWARGADDAIAIARTLTRPYRQARALSAAAAAAARSGNQGVAEALIEEASDRARADPAPYLRGVDVFSSLSLITKDPARRSELIAYAERATSGIGDAKAAAEAAGDLSCAIAAAGDIGRATAVAQTIQDPDSRGRALFTIAGLAAPPTQTDLIRQGLAVGDWLDALDVIARVEPPAVAALTRAYRQLL